MEQRLGATAGEPLLEYLKRMPVGDDGQRVTSNPLMLSMIASVYELRQGVGMPETIAELYKDASEAIQKANTFLSEHTFLAWPAETFPHSLANAHTHTHTLPHFSTCTQCRPPSSAAWTAATSSCRTGGSRVLPRRSHPPVTSPSQLAVQLPPHHLRRTGNGAGTSSRRF